MKFQPVERYAIVIANLALFLIGGVVAGMGSGAIFKGSLGTVMMIADPEHQAEALAGLLLAGYLGLSIPAIGLGVALRLVSPKMTLLGFSLVVAGALIAAAPTLLRAARARDSVPAANLARMPTSESPATLVATPDLVVEAATVSTSAQSRTVRVESKQAG